MLSIDHLAVVAFTIVLNVVTCRAARRNPAAPWIPWYMKGLAITQVANAVYTQVWFLTTGPYDRTWMLPCQLCDAAIVASTLALFRPRPATFELTYFWGLGAAVQGLITPSITERFPHPIFFQFFIVHVGLVTAAVFLAAGFRMTPRPRAVLRVMIWTNVVALVAGFVDWITGGNYMFLRKPPPTGSLLDYLGGWPWYLLVGEAVAWAVYSALDLPFRARRKRESPSAISSSPGGGPGSRRRS